MPGHHITLEKNKIKTACGIKNVALAFLQHMYKQKARLGLLTLSDNKEIYHN